MSKEWSAAQVWELRWWNKCANTYSEEMKQLLFADRMGLVRVPDEKTPYRFDMEEKSVLDIGGGPVSLLLKCVRVRGTVIDPLEFPNWVMERYKSAGISFERMKAEDMNIEERFDECWIYNCLQHVEDPCKIIEKARKIAKLIRIFEWLGTLNNVEGHPSSLYEECLNQWLRGEGKVEQFSGKDGCIGKGYYGVFPCVMDD